MSDSEVEWLEVVEETREALKNDPNNVATLLRQGQAYFHLEEFATAAKVLQTGLQVAPRGIEEELALVKKLELWLRKCNTHLSADQQVHIETKPEAPAASAPAPAPAATSSPAPAPAPEQPAKVRHEWFQSITHVMVTFFCKDRSEKDVDVEYATNSLAVTIRLGDGKEFQHTFSPLYADVVVAESSHVVGKYKVEIKLKKTKELQWRAMERVGNELPAPEVEPPKAAPRPTYPTSRPAKKDWDKVEAELKAAEADEKEEGDAALNKLFRDIYARADENTRRAMNKSFVESGGTVLSTNWSEVGSKYVEGTPPQGMEFKKPGE